MHFNIRGRNRGYREEPRRRAGQSRVASPIPAPEGLGLVQAFLNTVAPKADELRTPRRLSEWLSRQGLLPTGTELTRADLARAHDVRSGLRGLVAANSGRPLDDAVVTKLDRAAMGARAQIRFEGDGTSRLELVCRDLGDVLGTLFGFVHVARSEGKWPALKLCADPDCRRTFFDFTKNRSGRWCTERCGHKIRARARRRAAKASGR